MTTLHFCWLIDPWRRSREKYLRAWQELGWHCVLWHSGQIEEPPVEGVELRQVDDLVRGEEIEEAFEYERQHGSHASCADLFRYLVLFKHGGAYVDIDVFPALEGRVMPEDDSDHPLFGIPTPGSANKLALEIRFIRGNSGDELLGRLCKRAIENEEQHIRGWGYIIQQRGILYRTGPVMAGNVVKEYAREKGISFPSFLILATLDNTPENGGKENYGVGLIKAIRFAYAQKKKKKKIQSKDIWWAKRNPTEQ